MQMIFAIVLRTLRALGPTLSEIIPRLTSPPGCFAATPAPRSEIRTKTATTISSVNPQECWKTFRAITLPKVSAITPNTEMARTISSILVMICMIFRYTFISIPFLCYNLWKFYEFSTNSKRYYMNHTVSSQYFLVFSRK